MPTSNGAFYCLNHPSTKMEKNDTFNALMVVRKQAEAVTFDLGSGVPVVTFVCPTCGYIELYAARKTDSWERGKP